jgi:hypothetical protein
MTNPGTGRRMSEEVGSEDENAAGGKVVDDHFSRV